MMVLQAEYDRREKELLEANNALLERARKAEGKIIAALDRAEDEDPTDSNALGRVVSILKNDPTEGQVFVEDGEQMACVIFEVIDHFGGSLKDCGEDEKISDFIVKLAKDFWTQGR